MKNWKITPADSLIAKYVDCYWLLQKTEQDGGPDFPKLNPDPAGHIILASSELPYKYQSELEVAEGRGSHIILPHSRTLSMDHSKTFLIMGIKLQVGALYSLAFPSSELAIDKVIGLESNEFVVSNTEQVLSESAQSPERLRDYLDGALRSIILTTLEDNHTRLVRKVINMGDITELAKLGLKLSCSQRTVERSFKRVTGFTLKQYASMQRLEGLLDYVHQLENDQLDWADIAHQFAFSDQPHLVRYLKSVIGNTPGQYTQLRDLAIDAYGNFE